MIDHVRHRVTGWVSIIMATRDFARYIGTRLRLVAEGADLVVVATRSTARPTNSGAP